MKAKQNQEPRYHIAPVDIIEEFPTLQKAEQNQYPRDNHPTVGNVEEFGN
jgi:hypothetical protein